MEHRAVAGIPSAEVVPFDDARKAPAFAHPDDVHLVVDLEQLHGDAVTRFSLLVVGSEAKLTQNARRLHPALAEVARPRPVHPLWLDELYQPKLRRLIAVPDSRFLLNHHAGASLQHRHRHHLSVGCKDLRHSHLLANDACDHADRSGLTAPAAGEAPL